MGEALLGMQTCLAHLKTIHNTSRHEIKYRESPKGTHLKDNIT